MRQRGRDPKGIVTLCINKIPDEFNYKFNLMIELDGIFKSPQLHVPEYRWKLWELVITLFNNYIRFEIADDGSPDILNTETWKVEIWKLLTEKTPDEWRLR